MHLYHPSHNTRRPYIFFLTVVVQQPNQNQPYNVIHTYYINILWLYIILLRFYFGIAARASVCAFQRTSHMSAKLYTRRPIMCTRRRWLMNGYKFTCRHVGVLLFIIGVIEKKKKNQRI